MDDNYPLAWIISGVSGAGKSTIGRLFAQRLDGDFLEGDRRHPIANINKMIQQIPLQDEDRLPWIEEIENDIRQAVDKNREMVITCSALKKSFRQQLMSLKRVQLVFIDLPESLLIERLKERKYYMKYPMLASQIKAFEPIGLEESNVIIVNGDSSIDTVISELMTRATHLFPALQQSWWERGSSIQQP